ncbi:MAG: hypothetical protein P1U89_13015 [Verrucomicrobiales bacterium]|nr:hypothetical protein [Verrucomicrobiales bacterium]
MTKIKFNCPSCNAKLKVPSSLAGVSGPCPKCGGTIVAPLQSEEEYEPTSASVVSSPPVQRAAEAPAQKHSISVSATAVADPPQPQRTVTQPPVINQPIAPPPVFAQQPAAYTPPPQQAVESRPAVSQPSPPVINQPVHQAPASNQPSQHRPAPTISNEIGFPRPLEQVSHTAAVALANAPASFQQSQPQAPEPQVYQQPAPEPAPPQAPAQPEVAPPAAENYPEQSYQQYAAQTPAPAEPAVEIPEEIFEADTPAAAPEAEQAPAQEPQDNYYQHQQSEAYNQAYVPQTQPIVVKRRQEEVISQDSEQAPPRLDASLAEAGGDTLSAGQAAYQPDSTFIQLPEVGSEANEENFSINPAERPPYRPPNPVALTPPNQAVQEEPAYQQAAVEEVPQDYSYQVEPEFPLEDPVVEPIEEYHEVEEPEMPGSGTGSVAAFLAEAMETHSSQEGNASKSKDEILDELLGVAPKGKKKKKGLSASTKFMLSILAAVAVCAGIGVYYAIDQIGGFSMSGENVFGEEGLRNLEKKTGINISGITGSKKIADADEGEPEIPAITPPEPEVPEQIEIPSVEPEEMTPTEVASRLEDEIPAAIPPVEEPPIPDQNDAANEMEITPPTPAPSPLPAIAKENYSPKPYYPAPGRDDPPLKNTHDLVDAYLRAPNWEARIPYTYQGESLRPAIAEYYQKWPDFSLDRFKMKLFQMEMEEEFGGPFWVYQITKSDADPGGVPMIIRVENGHLKVDWQVYSEFSDEHFLKFREGKIGAPHTFRLVAERVSEYPGADKPGFTDLDNYLCFELNPPYGGYRAYSEYAFVKKGTEIARVMNEKIGLGDDPLAVILKIDREGFSHGIRHYVIKEFVDEGWFK